MTGNRLGKTKRLAPALLIATTLAGMPALAQTPAPVSAPATGPATPAAPVAQARSGLIHSISVSGNQRLEADTVRSYIKLRAGDTYTPELLDQALKDLYASEL